MYPILFAKTEDICQLPPVFKWSQSANPSLFNSNHSIAPQVPFLYRHLAEPLKLLIFENAEVGKTRQILQFFSKSTGRYREKGPCVSVKCHHHLTLMLLSWDSCGLPLGQVVISGESVIDILRPTVE